MDKKVVSLAEWKKGKGRDRTPDRISTPTASESHVGIRKLVADISGTDGDDDGDNQIMRMGLVATFKSRLNRLHPLRDPRKIAEARALAKTYDDDQLFGLMSKATDYELRIRPSFYLGLLEEAKSRI